MRALIIEDQHELALFICRILTDIGLASDRADSLATARDCLLAGEYDLILLDRRLPDGDGLDLIRSLPPARPPVIAISAADTTSDKVQGLDAGLDDYVIKPFDRDELAARIRVALRRPRAQILPPIRVGLLSFDSGERSFAVNDRPLLLAQREFALLEALALRTRRVVLRERLWAQIYGDQEAFQENALDALVSRLRRKLLDENAECQIKTVRGVGYMLTPP
jgi:two-component system, OmpR family, response regulator